MFQINSDNVDSIKSWLETRGGIAVWDSQDLSDPGFSLTTPYLTENGLPKQCPHWKCGKTPSQIITDINEVEVIITKEVKRFHVGVKRGSGLMLVVTDTGKKKIEKEIKKAGEGAYYVFDYENHKNCVIMKVEKTIPLKEYKNGSEQDSNML